MMIRCWAAAVFILALGASPLARASACCGGSFVFPSLISGDDQAQVTGSLNYSQVTDDVLPDGLWVKRATPETMETFKLDGALLLSDRWQTGVSVPVSRRERNIPGQTVSSSGLGDVSVFAGFEALPEWDYSLYRPKGIVFAQATLPTGTSVYDSGDPQGLDVRGRGFYNLGLGGILTKAIYSWDAQLTGEFHRSLPRPAQVNGGSVSLSPGWGGSVFAGGGWNRKELRLGGGIAVYYEDPVALSGAVSTPGNLQRFWAGILQASYLIDQQWAAALAYSDQSLFGEPVNASLSRAATVSLQRRWER